MKKTCTNCRKPIVTGEAVLRGNGYVQRAFHSACFTLARATHGIDAQAIAQDERDARLGLSLSERMARAGTR